MDNKKLLETLKEVLELAKSDPNALDKADIFDFKTKQKVASFPTDKLSPPRGQLKAVGTEPSVEEKGTKSKPTGSFSHGEFSDELKSLISSYYKGKKGGGQEAAAFQNPSAKSKKTPTKTHLPIDGKPDPKKPFSKSQQTANYQTLEKGIKEKVAAFIALTKNQAQHHLASFWDEVNRNDGAFYYAFSDDPYSAAQDRKTLDSLHLKAQALGPDAVKMLEGFHAYHQGRVTGKHAAKPEKPQLAQQQFGKSEEQNLNKANAQCPHCKGKAVTAVLDKFKMCKKCYGKKIKEQIKAKRAELSQNPKYIEYLNDNKVKDATRAEAENPFKPKDVGSPQPSKDDEKPMSRLPGFIIRGR